MQDHFKRELWQGWFKVFKFYSSKGLNLIDFATVSILSAD